ncbi:MAG: phage terminase large subunit family protein, partial [Planctomycetota bacterium]
MSLTILSDKKTLTPEEYSFYYGHLRNARRPRIRSMLEFAEQEIVLPNGPYEGRRYRWEWQPYGRLYFEAVDSGLWNRFNATGPTQTGKTLHCFATPTLFHLFEVGETVICGVADEDMAADKWRDDLLPVIERTRYRELLPRHGAGARGGKIKDAIQFRHGPVLKFMTGGGGDKSRAAFTARVLVVTETDGLDTSDTTSREADKVRQLEARTRAYDDAKRVYLECTVSIPEGRTWQEYTAGTKSKIVLPCPRCRAWVTPEREHLQGWQDAESEIEARELAHFCCPDCGQHWTEEERREANLRGQLLHRGQEIDEKGKIAGPLPQTQTLGFRWSHVNNFFSSAGNAGAEEWRKPRAVDEENAEKELCQFTWALPYKGPVEEEAHLDPHLLAERTVDLPKGIVPAGTEFLTMGLDLGKWQAHWILVAWKAG